MPTLNIVTHDGRAISAPLPPGVTPDQVTPDLVNQVVQHAGLETHSLASQFPGAGVTGPDGAPQATPQEAPSMLHRAGSAILRAASDRVVDPLATVFSMDPKIGTWDRLMAEGQIAGTIAAPGLTAMGASVQAGSEMMGADPSTARLLGGVAEIGGGLMSVARSASSIGKNVRTMVAAAKKGIEAIGESGLSRAESVGKFVRNEVVNRFRELRQDFGRQFNQAESTIRKSTPMINPGAPGYDELNQILHYADDAAASAGQRADSLIKKIRDAVYHTGKDKLPDPQPVSMDDVISLRKILNERAGASKALDPDASIVGKKAAEMRDRTMDVIRSAAPQDVASRYDELRQAARVSLYEPERFLTALTNNKTTPLKAFKAVFLNNDPNALRTVGSVLAARPGVANKLRFGVVEALQDAFINGEAGAKAAKRLETFEPTIMHLNLFKPEEIEAMKFLLKSNMTPSLVRELTTSARSNQVLLRGALGAQMASQVASSPLALGIGALAFGGLPQLRRAAMLPAGSTAQRKLLGVVIRNASKGFQLMFAGDQQAAQ